MIPIDWSLIVGYNLEDAIEYLKDEGEAYEIKITTAPLKRASNPNVLDRLEELRVISVRKQASVIQLICAEMDWTIS